MRKAQSSNRHASWFLYLIQKRSDKAAVIRLKTVTTTPIVKFMSGEDLSKLLITPGGGTAHEPTMDPHSEVVGSC